MMIVTDQNDAGLNVTMKLKRKRRRRKMGANGQCSVQGMDQGDRSVQDTENKNNGTMATPCSQEEPMELDFTTKLSQENPRSSVNTAMIPLKKPSKSGRKWLRRVKREANEECTAQAIDPEDKNMYDVEIRENGVILEPCSPDKPMELDSIAKLFQENPKSSAITSNNLLEKLSKSKMRRLKKARKKAAAKVGSESTDHMKSGGDTLSNPLEKLSKSKMRRLKKARKKAAAKVGSESMNHMKSGGDTRANPLMKLSKSKRERLRKQRKKLAAKLGLESMDHINIVSNLSLADASDACVGDNINNGKYSSEESRRSNGNEICEKIDMQPKSSDIINEMGNNLSTNAYGITQRRKLLILDVNGLLADVVFPAPKRCKPDKKTLGRAIFKRPFYLGFLNFCFERFDVGIWSSRTKKVLDKVVDYLLGDLKLKLRFCWDASYCTGSEFKTLEKKNKPMVFKELKKLWEKHDPALPWEKGDYDESNTLLLDDSPYKALLNPMHTGVFPCSYTYRDKRDNLLGPRGKIRVYLEDLAAAENVQHYVAQNPFGQSPINETNPNWNFYSRVLQSLLGKSGKEV